MCLDTKVKQLEEIIQKNTSVLESHMTQEIQKENPKLKIAKMMRRKYPQSFESEIQQKCLEYFKKQFAEAFDTGDTRNNHSMEDDTPIQDAQDPEDIWVEIFDNKLTNLNR